MNLNIDVIRDINDALSTNNVHLIIGADILSSQSYNVLKNLAIALKPGGFILLEESIALFDSKALLKTGLIPVGKQGNSVGTTYLLLKKRENKGEQIVIDITEKNLLRLNNMKNCNDQILRITSPEVLFVSQGKELCGNITRKIS